MNVLHSHATYAPWPYTPTRQPATNTTEQVRYGTDTLQLSKWHAASAGPANTVLTDYLSSKTKGELPSNIWTGAYATFELYPYVGALDHHEWMAPIKAVMSVHGQNPLGIFEEITPTGQGLNITMKDGFKLHITHTELETASRYAKFAGEDKGMVKDARFLFAVMNKRKQLETQYIPNTTGYGYELQKRNFNAVVSAADNGIGGHAGLELLGLGGHLKQVWSQDIGSAIGVPAVQNNWYKRGMMSDGKMDRWGTQESAPKWIESFIVLKEPARYDMHVPLGEDQRKPFTFELEPLPSANPKVADNKLPDLSPKRGAEKPLDPMLGFHTVRPLIYQGETSTHADVIKLLMNRYGQSPTSVFSNVTFADNIYTVTFRDGFELILSRDELELATEYSLFQGDDEGLLKDANFIFAAYIKRQQLQPPRASFGFSFEAALMGNLAGRTVKNILEGMGINNSIKYVERAGDADGMVLMIAGNSGGLFFNGTYAVEGEYISENGSAHRHGYQLA